MNSDFKEMAIWGGVLLGIVLILFAVGARKSDPVRDQWERKRMAEEAEREARKLPRSERPDPRLDAGEATRQYNEKQRQKNDPLSQPYSF